ncbi:MAG: hypothetical protein M1820_007859 [Bogoriella megaspora]|nr:MAG: hypothetical protein M1820_007859 [Bogoriella megaspora]
MAWSTIIPITRVVFSAIVGHFIYVTYDHRRKINELCKQGLPMPKEWSWITGQLLVLQEYVNGIPSDAAVAFAMRDLCQDFARTEIFLVDFWPVYPPLFAVFGPEAASQICNKYNLPKTTTAARFMKPVTGGPDLISMNGKEWKYWRSLFNPGFSTGAMLNNVPHIVDSVLVFREKLIERIAKGMFSLDELTTKLIMEIILKVTLDNDTNYQRSSNVLATALGRILRWHSFWDPRVLMHPLRFFVQRHSGQVMDTYILEFQTRFQEIKSARASGGSNGTPNTSKSVIALALEAYLDDHRQLIHPGDFEKATLDTTFAKHATSQIRLFLFAGSDTTASMMVYVYHMLSKHPAWLRRLRGEHDYIFGRDPVDAASRLKENPGLLNDCKLTIAFIKETLRLHAPAGSLRSGLPGVSITDLQGNELPMDYAGANILHQALHLNPRVWPRANEFLPERFLVKPEHELYPDPAAYRPFEQGPRNCIGQTLVWNELRVAVVLTCRDLEIRDAYADFDAKNQSEMSVLGKLKRRVFGEPIKTLHGERAYQTDSGGCTLWTDIPAMLSGRKHPRIEAIDDTYFR